MENRIQEQQLYLFTDQTSCSWFIANPFRLLLTSAAYLLIDPMRREGLKDTELGEARVDGIRLKLLKVAARVVVSDRCVVLHLAEGSAFQPLLPRLVSRLMPI